MRNGSGSQPYYGICVTMVESIANNICSVIGSSVDSVSEASEYDSLPGKSL